jgi:hypothetical protein
VLGRSCDLKHGRTVEIYNLLWLRKLLYASREDQKMFQT